MSAIKILLVEDEKTLVQIVSETLRSKGFTVETAYDGAEGLKRFFEIHPDVLIADVMMPRLDGFEMVRRIRKTDDHTPVLFLTAKSTPDDVVTGFELGANDYLKKPFAIQELIVRIKALMSDRLQFLFLELPNCKSALTPKATLLDNFCYALRNLPEFEDIPEEFSQEIFTLLFNSAEIATFTTDERNKYKHDMTTQRDIRNQIAYARREGVAEGIAQGIAEGEARGEARGEAKGAETKAIEVAKNLKSLGIPLDKIAQATGLSVEQIQQL